MSEKEDVNKNTSEPLDDEALEKLATEELMKEAVQGAARAELIGPSGWIKSTQKKTNKRFLANTIRHAVASNDYYTAKNKQNRLHNREKLEPYYKKDRPTRKHK